MQELPKDNFVSEVTNTRILALTDMRHILVNSLARIATADPNTRRMMNIIIDEIHKTEQRLIAQRNTERATDYSFPLHNVDAALNAAAMKNRRTPPPPPPARTPVPPVKPPTKE